MTNAKRYGWLLALVLALGVLAGDRVVQSQTAVNMFQFPELVERKPFQRWWWAFQQRAYPMDDIPANALTRAFRQVEQARAARGAAELVSGSTWVNIGPAPISGFRFQLVSGRVAEVTVDPSNPNRWLIGAAQGGIWETTDAGATWTPKTDDQVSLAMGAITFAPSNPAIIYAGTGEAVPSGAYGGGGLLKSSDGGATWQLLVAATFAKTSFSDIKVDPLNPDVVLAATVRGIAGRDKGLPPDVPLRGILKSTDGGVTWSQKLAGEGTDLEVDPTNFDNQYAGLDDAFFDPSPVAPNGVYRSFDAGNTWTVVNGPWVAIGMSDGIGRVELALSPSQPGTLYVSIMDGFNSSGFDGGLLGLWRTDNAFAATPTWTQVPLMATDNSTGRWGYCGWDAPLNRVGSQCDYDHEILVDPMNENILYAGGIPLWKCEDCGAMPTWTEVSKTTFDPINAIHVDQHTMAWAENRLIVGNDGGVWSTTDGGNTWANHNTTLAITQFYEGSLHATNPNFALAGAQDNGSAKWTGTDDWPSLFGGDGQDNAISSSDPDNHWAVSFQRLSILRTLTGGGLLPADTGISKAAAPFSGKFEKCPANDDVFIAGTDRVWRSNDFFMVAGPTWAANGPELPFAQVSALAFAPTDTACNTYAVGTTNEGHLRLTTNGGATYADIDVGNLVPGRHVTDLEFDPTNADILYVTLSGFDEGTPLKPGHVFKTTNARAAAPLWTNISPPVNLPHNTIVVDPSDPNTVYVGTDLGVWKSSDGGPPWTHMGPATGMPNVAVYELKINPTTDRLVAFTHGRSAFALLPDTGPFLLTITKAGTGSGTVTSNPAGIDCGLDCTENYATHKIVNLTATADTGFTFAGWSGDPDCSDGSVTMSADRNCTATFDVQPVGLHDLAVTRITAPPTVTLTNIHPTVTRPVKVQIQNRSPDNEIISNSEQLGGLVQLTAQALNEACNNAAVALAQNQVRLPKTLRPKQLLTVNFDVTFDCAVDPLRSTAQMAHDDFRYQATVNHAVLDDLGDGHPDCDTCPRAPLENEPNPDGKITDKGCAEEITDVVDKR